MTLRALEEIKENLQNEIYKNLADSKEAHDFKIIAISVAINTLKNKGYK